MSIITGILIVFIIGLLVWQKHPSLNFFAGKPANQTANNNANENSQAASVAAGKAATQNLINEVKTSAESGQPNSTAKVVTVNQIVDGKTVPVEAVSVAKGTSPIAVNTGEVVAKSGEVAQNNVSQGTASSPTQSNNISQSQLPKNSINLILNQDQTITPSSFTVHPGQAVALAITNNTSRGEIIIFQDPSLAAIAFSLLPNTTRAMTFNAPTTMGDYPLYSNLPAQAAAGMKGDMIVK